MMTVCGSQPGPFYLWTDERRMLENKYTSKEKEVVRKMITFEDKPLFESILSQLER